MVQVEPSVALVEGLTRLTAAQVRGLVATALACGPGRRAVDRSDRWIIVAVVLVCLAAGWIVPLIGVAAGIAVVDLVVATRYIAVAIIDDYRVNRFDYRARAENGAADPSSITNAIRTSLPARIGVTSLVSAR
ncbi:hypothetical protein nbrc107697_26060 [Gordonia crocea]|uniref:Uncharacterized protein n=1 Tax=Gordonia crocea TaxID=589162 RepID=A0A7I9UZF5_9ACTN|nr:hypothetical protein nbrc107697_26060 [Gordonia crocea]